MHKEYYETTDSVDLVVDSDKSTMLLDLAAKLATLEAQVPKPLIIGTASTENTDIHGKTLYVGSITYRRRKKV